MNSMTPNPLDQLTACASRAAGLLHLLSVAYAKADEGTLHSPTKDEVEGITWLSLKTSEDLNDAVKAISDASIIKAPNGRKG
jgi:hypothetical protein